MVDEYIQSRVSGPAYALIGVGAIGIAAQLMNIAVNLMNVGVGAVAVGNGSDDAIVTLLSGTVGMGLASLAILLGGVIIFAGFKMKDCQSWNLAAGASVLAMLPCLSPCCILGLPAGIWSLMVLMDDEVKEEFLREG